MTDMVLQGQSRNASPTAINGDLIVPHSTCRKPTWANIGRVRLLSLLPSSLNADVGCRWDEPPPGAPSAFVADGHAYSSALS